MSVLCREQSVYFRNKLRVARDAALHDSEGFQQVLFAVEQLGRQKWQENNKLPQSLGQMKGNFSQFVDSSFDGKGDTDFATLYQMMVDGRNDAMHVGAVARSLTATCVKISIVLEEALMATVSDATIEDYMVHSPVVTYEWQRIGLIRQTMLEHSFSHLPFFRKGLCTWHLVSAHEICHYLRECRNECRNSRLAKILSEAIQEDRLTSTKAKVVCPEDRVECALNKTRCGEPVLVLHPATNDLIGVANSFDLM